MKGVTIGCKKGNLPVILRCWVFIKIRKLFRSMNRRKFMTRREFMSRSMFRNLFRKVFRVNKGRRRDIRLFN
jgi:hypothetical protein